MNCFLVTFGSSLDDLPVSIHATLNEALDAANRLESDSRDVINAYQLAGREECSPVCVQVWGFDAFGKLVSHQPVKHW